MPAHHPHGHGWRPGEEGLEGPGGLVLVRISGHNAFWFAIANQDPDAVLFEG